MFYVNFSVNSLKFVPKWSLFYLQHILAALLVTIAMVKNKIRKEVSKGYHRNSEFIVKYNISLKTLLEKGISEPVFYGEKFINSKELLENVILVINSKILSNVIKGGI